MQLWKLALSLAGVAALLVACGQKKDTPQPTFANITLQAAADVNPDVDGRPSPIVVRVYYLTALDAFRGADFFALFEQDEAILADKLVNKEELQLAVGEQRSFTRPLNDRVRYIGFLGAYRDIEQARWRATVEILPNRTTPLVVDFARTAVSVTVR